MSISNKWFSKLGYIKPWVNIFNLKIHAWNFFCPNKSLGGQKATSFYDAMVCLWINLYSTIDVRDHITSQLNSFPSNILSFLKDSFLFRWVSSIQWARVVILIHCGYDYFIITINNIFVKFLMIYVFSSCLHLKRFTLVDHQMIFSSLMTY